MSRLVNDNRAENKYVYSPLANMRGHQIDLPPAQPRYEPTQGQACAIW